MIIDSSAVLAVLFGEADAETYEKGIATASPCRMSVANGWRHPLSWKAVAARRRATSSTFFWSAPESS